MKQCSLCRERFDKPLFLCWVLKEGRAGYEAKPNYKMIVGFKTLGLCLKCKEVPTKFSDELLNESPYLKDQSHYPIPLMNFDEEEKLTEKWKEELVSCK